METSILVPFRLAETQDLKTFQLRGKQLMPNLFPLATLEETTYERIVDTSIGGKFGFELVILKRQGKLPEDTHGAILRHN